MHRIDRLARTAIALAMALAAAGCGGSAPPPAGAQGSAAPASAMRKPDRLRIGFQAIPNAELVARQLRWHEETLGIPIEWRQFESGRDVNTAIAAGSLDVGLSGSGGAATGLAQGLPYSVIAIHDVIGRSEALAVRPSIRRAADLRGRRIAAPFGSTTHYSLLQWLRLEGIGPGEVALIDLNPSDLTAAWIRGDVDAAYVWQPTLQRLYDAGAVRLTSSDELAARGFPTFDVAVASRDLTTRYPELVAAYLRTLSRAVMLYRTDRTTALDAIARELNVSPEQAALQAGGLLWLTADEQLDPKYFGASGAPGGLTDALETTARFLVEQGVIRMAPPRRAFEEGVDGRFLRLAATQG